MHSFVLLTAALAAPAALANPTPQKGAPKGGWPHHGGHGRRPEWWHPSWKAGHHGYDEAGEPKWLARQRADAVKEAFQFAWDGYSQYAFPNDELQPINNSFTNSRNGWGASAVDALSTAAIMELPEIVNQIVDYIPAIDFSISYEDQSVSVFETTIRYLGGMLSGYDLLTGPLAYLAENQGNVEAILQQSQNLADILSFAFESPTGIPSNNIFLSNRSTDGSDTNGLATIGTLVLEWTHLSDLTGNDRYADLSQAAESYLLNAQPAWAEPFPGLLGTNVNITTGEFVDADGGWNGGDDSYYEYLIKMFVYDSSRFASYRDAWIEAADSTIANLASNPSSRRDLTYLAQFMNQTLQYDSGHLACFDGGNFILGGLVLGEQRYTDFGLELVNACHNTYDQTLTGIGPESFSWNVTALPANQTEFYERAGFYITDSRYILRPEVIESFYYAYRATGSRLYQDWAWNAFVNINATTRIGSGFSSVEDVNAPGGGEATNFQESFLFAEVMKYSYLIHAPDSEWQVNHNGQNDWVFNTEAHPVKVVGPPV
ncbi:hypothetical protein MBLNU230_g2085t1 [Neophaeotheca triangularis]